ncbi:MAG: hypothetical protein JW937_08980 [Candidatus Omnitrophica bacterium]|nr:hypothetical protein [Candidatus Omnitrophota bacterium]
MKKLLLIVLVSVICLLAILYLGRNLIVKNSVSFGVKTLMGVDLDIDKLDINMARTYIGIQGMRLASPKGFQEPVMLNIPEIMVNYKMGSLLTGKPHFEELKLHLKELVVEKNTKGDLNLMALAPARSPDKPKEEKAPEEPKDKKSKADFQIDLLTLKVDRVVYKDYSAGGEPKIQTYNVGINYQQKNVGDLKALVGVVMTQALMKTSISRLTNLEMGQILGDAGAALQGTGAAATQAVGSAVTQGKELSAQTAESAKEAVNKLKGSLGGLLGSGE